jgi:hypothetical protein
MVKVCGILVRDLPSISCRAFPLWSLPLRCFRYTGPIPDHRRAGVLVFALDRAFEPQCVSVITNGTLRTYPRHSQILSPLRKSAVRDGRARGCPMVVYKPILILSTLLCHFLSKKERKVKRACSIDFVPFTVCPLPMAPPISTHKSPQQLFAPTGKNTACLWQRHALSRESWLALCSKQYQYWL